MLKLAKVVLSLAALSMVSASAFADQDLATLAKRGTLGIYHKAIKPIPSWIQKSAKNAKDGTIFVATKLGDGGKAVGTALYKSGDAVVTHVVDPVAETAARAAYAIVKVPTYDVAWNMILVPLKDGAVASTKPDADLLAMGKATSDGIAEGGKSLNADMNGNVDTTAKNTKRVYEVTAVPVYKGTKAATLAVYHGIIRIFSDDKPAEEAKISNGQESSGD